MAKTLGNQALAVFYVQLGPSRLKINVRLAAELSNSTLPLREFHATTSKPVSISEVPLREIHATVLLIIASDAQKQGITRPNDN